jgi:hypothetical protein
VASEKIRESWRAASKKYRTKQIAKGLCRHCPKPIYKNKRCLYHFEKDKSAQNAKKLRRLETGKCISCGKPLIYEDGENYCVNCSSKLWRIELHETT